MVSMERVGIMAEKQGRFELKSDYAPRGDQPKAIESLVKGIHAGYKHQILLGVTGSGKTFTMANVIAKINKPTLVLAPNKTLAAQLAAEFKEFFPNNAEEKLKQYIQQNGLSDKVMVELNTKGVQITLRDVALYDTGSAVLKPDAKRVLAGIAPFLKALPNKISIEGHTDNVPIHNAQFRSNFDLSTARALNVLYYFQDQQVPPERMSATGYGEYAPVASNDTQEGRAANRRVNVIVLRNPIN